MEQADHESWWSERGARELRELLFRDWDPIGLKELVDAPLDEYEHYAGQLARRLRAGASDDQLAAALEGYRVEMGLDPSPEPPLALARRLREWYAGSLAAWRAGGPSGP
jgi:hypothetical protein